MTRQEIEELIKELDGDRDWIPDGYHHVLLDKASVALKFLLAERTSALKS